MTETVSVLIVGEERVRYHQIKTMPKAEFERLDAMLDSDDRKERNKAQQIIGYLWIDRRDVFDSDDFEIDDFKTTNVTYSK